MKTTITILTAIAAVTTASFAFADMSGVDVEIKASTLGAGVELNYAINSKFTVGVGLNNYSISTTESADNIDYDMDLNLQTIALLANYHPFEGTFRLTAGVMSNGNELKLKGKPSSGTYDIGGTTYNASDVGTLEGKVDFNAIAPYLGLGWGKSPSRGFGATMDIGVLFQGSPNVHFSANGAIASDPTFQANLKQEQANAEEDISGFTMFPVISLGLNYRF